MQATEKAVGSNFWHEVIGSYSNWAHNAPCKSALL